MTRTRHVIFTCAFGQHTKKNGYGIIKFHLVTWKSVMFNGQIPQINHLKNRTQYSRECNKSCKCQN